MKQNLRKRFVWGAGTIEIHLVDWDDGYPFGYVWVGTSKKPEEPPTYTFDLTRRQAITLAKNILLAAKQTKHKIRQ